MAIIYNYTKSTSITDDDMLIGTDNVSGLPTKNFSLFDIKTYVLAGVDGVITVTGAQGPVGPAGAPGKDGSPGEPGKTVVGPAGLTWKGLWAQGSAYAKNDAVGYDGSSYFCVQSIADSQVNPLADTTHWALLAAQGADGSNGSDGDKGDPGDDGDPGNGIASVVGGFYTPGTTGTLITNSSLVTPDSWYRVKLNFTDTTTWLSGNIRGARGAAGDTPETGNFVTDVNAGPGLKLQGGNVPSPTLLVGQGNGISVFSSTDAGESRIAVKESEVDHDKLKNYVKNQHIDWTVSQITEEPRLLIDEQNIPSLDYVEYSKVGQVFPVDEIITMKEADFNPSTAKANKMYVLL